MQKIKNVIFDLGGVVLNIDPNAVASRLGEMGVEVAQLFNNQYVKEILADFETGRIDTVAFRSTMRNHLGNILADDDDFDAVWDAILLDFPNDRVEILLELRKRYPIYLLSNTNRLHYDKFSSDFLARFGFPFDSLFRHAFYSFQMGLVKPDVEIFRAVIQQTAVNPEETLFIDDNAENTQSAARVGLQTLTVTRNEGWEHLVDMLEEF